MMKSYASLLKQYKTLATWLGVLVLCLSVLISKTQLLICDEGSLPEVRVSLVLKGSTYKPGDMVGIKDHSVQYVGKKLLVKRVIGLPGDRVERTDGKIQVRSQNAHNKSTDVASYLLLDKTRDGKVLNPLKSTVIPERYVFVAGDHPRSFDSRYQEFGLVHQGHIMGRAIKLW